MKVGKNELKRITVREGDTAHGLSTEFANTHGLSKDMRTKLEILLKQHMTSVLTKIDEIGWGFGFEVVSRMALATVLA